MSDKTRQISRVYKSKDSKFGIAKCYCKKNLWLCAFSHIIVSDTTGKNVGKMDYQILKLLSLYAIVPHLIYLCDMPLRTFFGWVIPMFCLRWVVSNRKRHVNVASHGI